MKTPNTESLSRRAWSVEEWRAMYGLGRNSVYNLINSGRLKTAKVGRRRIVTAEADAAFRASLDKS